MGVAIARFWEIVYILKTFQSSENLEKSTQKYYPKNSGCGLLGFVLLQILQISGE